MAKVWKGREERRGACREIYDGSECNGCYVVVSKGQITEGVKKGHYRHGSEKGGTTADKRRRKTFNTCAKGEL